jgi:hypothetical protein
MRAFVQTLVPDIKEMIATLLARSTHTHTYNNQTATPASSSVAQWYFITIVIELRWQPLPPPPLCSHFNHGCGFTAVPLPKQVQIVHPQQHNDPGRNGH